MTALTYPKFKVQKPDSAEDKDSVESELNGKTNGAMRGNCLKATEMRELGTTTLHQVQEQKLWAKVVEHLASGASFERLGY